ncbi:MAG: MFS transporter [Chloroflexi bacterium]|nr:MFS transporter [Chloroflexota bacterium]
MTLTVLPLFLAGTLGFTTVTIGLIEGFAETTASLSKMGSGWLSDRLRQRKSLTLVGYGLSACSKPFLALATAAVPVLAIRLADRLGKGIRTSPRDALIADSATEATRGVSFGLHRSLDTAGAFLGLALVALIVYLSQGGALVLSRETYVALVLIAAAPGFLALVVLAAFVRDIPMSQRHGAAGCRSAARLDGRFKLFVAIAALFTLGNSSDAFLLLRAQSAGFSVLEVSLALLLFNFVYTALATPLGALADGWGKSNVLAGGWLLYAIVYVSFALLPDAGLLWLLYPLYGVYYAMTEGVGRALVADLVTSDVRGTAYGVYHAAIGITALPASLLAGLLWQGVGTWEGFGPSAPFLFGGGLALAAAALVTAFFGHSRKTLVPG